MVKKSMKKLVLIALVGLIFGNNVVYAADCNALLTQDAYDFIREILGYVTIAVPILLIILCSTDLASIVISQDDNATKKAMGRIVKRFIAGAAFFFVPLIVRLLLGLEPVKDSLNLVDDPMCGIIDESAPTTPDSDI